MRWRRTVLQALAGYALLALETTARMMYQTPQLGKLFVGDMRGYAYQQSMQKRRRIFIKLPSATTARVLKPGSKLFPGRNGNDK